MEHKKYQRWTHETVCLFSEQKGGKFLSDNFNNINETHEWKCSNGHKWRTKARNVLNFNTWCPKCTRNITEERCRYVFEQLTGQKWIRTRDILPDLELDGYCDFLHSAFEYNGEQHYHKNHLFRKAKDSFAKQQQRDQLKKSICNTERITLIVISYKEKYRLEEYIEKQLKYHNIPVVNNSAVNWSDFDYCKSKLQHIQLIAHKKNGHLISLEYGGAFHKYKWKCSVGHTWNASIYAAKRHWCSICSRKNVSNRIRIKTLQKYKSIKSEYIDWNDYRINRIDGHMRTQVAVFCPHCKSKRYKRGDKVYSKAKSPDSYKPYCHMCSCKRLK